MSATTTADIPTVLTATTPAHIPSLGGAARTVDVASVARPIHWRTAKLQERAKETATAATLALDVADWPAHRAGQHVDIRLTAEDGYQAQRSYSIASAPEDQRLAITVERLDDGEVSPYLVDVMERGDLLEVRGPLGGWFVWTAALGGPLMLIAGGSGLVPLMSMLRHRAASGSDAPTRLLLSARTEPDALYTDELAALAQREDGFELFTTLTESSPPDWDGYRRRVDREMLDDVAWAPNEMPRVFICGPTGLVETVAGLLVELGHDPARVKTERFGPTGGASR